MFFEINGNKYGVKFYRAGTTTYAELLRFDNSSKQLYETNVVGVAALHHHDRFVKKVGRVVALTHLLNRLQEVSAGETEPELVLTREDRKLIWEEYFRTHKK